MTRKLFLSGTVAAVNASCLSVLKCSNNFQTIVTNDIIIDLNDQTEYEVLIMKNRLLVDI